jgi:hypothetical protein
LNFNGRGSLLCLDFLDRLTDQLGDVSDLHARERLNDSDQVLLEQGVVQRSEMGPDDGVIRKLYRKSKT